MLYPKMLNDVGTRCWLRLNTPLDLTMCYNFCRPELTMQDSDIGKDDLMGTKQLELDDLEVDKEITKVLNMDEV